MGNTTGLSVALMAFGILAAASPANAADDCQSAVSEYNSAVQSINYTLSRYARCITGSRGTDDCSTEFRRLKSAQSDFESAVSGYQAYCQD